jgi:hypothetical protein
MITKEDWIKGKEAWERIKKQAEIDIEQATLYIAAINIHLNSFEAKKE